MNWDAIGAIGEAIGAVAVLLTLGYLALQIRQNTAALRSTATQGAHDQAAELYRTLSTDSELGMILVRGIEAPDDLSEDELARFIALFSWIIFLSQNWYVQTRDQLMDDTLMSSWNRLISGVSGSPGFQYFWDQRAHIFSPAFREYLDTEVFATQVEARYRPLGVKRQ